jgi:putative ABC transport system ATP-binding protein
MPQRRRREGGCSVGDVLIRCVGVVKIYAAESGRVQALRGVDLRIDRGDAVVVVGPSGSGKSSLLRIIAGLDPPSAGVVEVDGVDLARVPRRRRRLVRSRLLSHVYQRPLDNLVSHETALEQVQRMAIRRRTEPAAALEMLERVGLLDRRDHRPGELSGGEQQRLAFARAAVGPPALIIADEPTAELDRASSQHVIDTMVALADEGITVLVASHDRQVQEQIAHVVTLRDGAIASIRIGSEELSVIDDSGRMQLPPDLRGRFPDGRARLAWDVDADRLTGSPP